jgi:thiol-disulfide isomerase/thioredoxin
MRTARTAAARSTIALLAAVALASSLAGQTLSGFTVSSDYTLQIDGQPASNARIYWSQPSRMFLIVLKDQPTPLLVEPVTRQVKSVPLMKLANRPDGTVSILEGAAMTPRGALSMTPDGVATFAVDGKAYRLQEKPPLVGWQTPESIAAYNSLYTTRSEAYRPQATAIAELKKQSADVKVTVYFGSWCPFCQQKVPMVMRLARELAGSKVKFDFYGLPHGFSNDAQAQRFGVKQVPLGIVFKNGKEVGRINADGWAAPEATLKNLIVG